MKKIFTLFTLLLIFSHMAIAQSGISVEPFKLGTFRINNNDFLGIVLRDEFIVDLNMAQQFIKTGYGFDTPNDMRSLIERYEHGLKDIIYEIVRIVVKEDMIEKSSLEFIYHVSEVNTLAPIMPGKMLNAAVNFYSHVEEANTPEAQRLAAERRRASRGIPYLFLKPIEGAVIGQGDSVIIPWGRDRIDWEVELAIVIGKTAKYVSATDATDYIFGYMVSLDISDRGGRPPNSRPGSDWFIGKGHDTFAPIGPWIVPKEFYGDPMERLEQVLEIDGEIMQRAGPGDMIHSIYELIEYGSSVITLYPGDVINNGTSGGTGAGTYLRGETRYLQPGQVIEASIDGIGTLILPVEGESEPPKRTGSYLPPVSSYTN
jgi:2-keto-4-pentenoate hydratase/2-oxohepta-3-ene-1,7-dioic acid hydratase in catechol pathway